MGCALAGAVLIALMVVFVVIYCSRRHPLNKQGWGKLKSKFDTWEAMQSAERTGEQELLAREAAKRAAMAQALMATKAARSSMKRSLATTPQKKKAIEATPQEVLQIDFQEELNC